VRFTIIGAGTVTGAVGAVSAVCGVIGARLVDAGHEVLLCDKDIEHVKAINAAGLSVGNSAVEVRAVTPEELPRRLDRVLTVADGRHAGQVAEWVRDRLTVDGYVVGFQHEPTVSALSRLSGLSEPSQAIGAGRLMLGLATFEADPLGPGRIGHASSGSIRVGELTGETTPRLTELVAALPGAEATGNILGLLWTNQARRAILAAGAVSDLSIADYRAPRWRPLMLAVAREVLARAPVEPEALDGFDPADLEGSLVRLVRHRREAGEPPLAGPLTTHTAELAGAIERGERPREVANLELLAAHERAERLGRPLNAVVKLFPAPPRAPKGPLHGVAVAVKDMIDVAGHPRGNGNPHRMAAEPAAADAEIVTRLRAAGADVFAATSLLEYAAGAVHPGVAEAMNPHRPERTAGGSSGGSAALVGAGACAVALGTDTGGSIRIPAHYCGVVGFKPSYGALPLEGIEPLAPTLDHAGLLARDVDTTVAVFRALTSEKPAPPTGAPRVGVVPGQLDAAEVEPDVAATVRAAIDRLRDAGYALVDVDASPFDALEETFSAILLFEAWRGHGARVGADPGHYGPETLRLLRSGAGVGRDDYEAALATRARLLPAANEVYAGIDVLLTPAAPFVAPVTTPPVDTPEGAAEGLFTGIHNLTGAPAVVLPCGWSRDGLPIGLQLSSRPGTDLALLAAARSVESTLAAERRPPAAS
jgi:Asp-tRNA(Asn)/Glu-tRNA(Gln) amidotransferase A subunit family amidase/ketopantoate reductase